jgi:hypothetical protein
MKEKKSELIIRAVNKSGVVKLIRNTRAKVIKFPRPAVYPNVNYFTIA